MMSLTGAFYPAIDLCAGEKERGTMETLLISPASREEIVYGKFLTIWVFSAMTALLNLVSMGITTGLLMPKDIPQDEFRASALFWGIVLLLPVSAFFSAVCLAVGAYARSSKEGQYYLMPLFMVTMPLIFLTLAPDVVLNPFWSMVPVTGVALLLQRLMVEPNPLEKVWPYFVPVLGPTVLYGWLALRWAVTQFQREEVLFREAERLDIGLWLRRLFRGYGLIDLLFQIGGRGDARAVLADSAEGGERLAVGPEVTRLALALDGHGEHQGEGVFSCSAGAGEDEGVREAAGGDCGAEVLDCGGVAEKVVEGCGKCGHSFSFLPCWANVWAGGYPHPILCCAKS